MTTVSFLARLWAPDSAGLLVSLAVVAVFGMVVVLLHRGGLLLRIVAGLVTLVVMFSAGAAAVNVSFGYFTTWSDVAAGLGGGPVTVHLPGAGAAGDQALTPAQIEAALPRVPAGRSGTLVKVRLAGRRSHITRQGLLWFPPQYSAPAYAHTRFPVVELIPGTPGQPADWVTSLHVTTILAALTAAGTIAPMVVVMVPSNPPTGYGHGQECTNKGTRGAQDSTYTGRDVPADLAGLRVYSPGPHWAVAGYSSGGYCAVDLTLKHPGTYGAVADLDGYLSPLEDGPLWHVIFNRNRAAIRAYDITAELAVDHRPLPPFYLVAGRGNREDLDDLITLRTLLRNRTAVTSLITAGGHTFPQWRAELPAMLTWISHHISPGAATPAGVKIEVQHRR